VERGEACDGSRSGKLQSSGCKSKLKLGGRLQYAEVDANGMQVELDVV